MISVALEEVVRVHCDCCGVDITNKNIVREGGLDFCLNAKHYILGRRKNCLEVHEERLKGNYTEIC